MDLRALESFPVSTVDDERVQLLQKRFGLEAFRPWQREAIDALLDGSGKALVVAPTGGGKSLCYQFPAAALEGTTIVISPLIALMEDQVHGLEARGIPATYLASNLDAAEKRTREAGLKEGRYRLVYVAPERLALSGMVEQLARLKTPLIAIDEAHCISHWGHDFRPDYLRLGEVLKKLAPPRIMACTATATLAVRDEILEKLGLPPDETKLVLRGFARPNLHLSAEEVDGSKDRARVTIATIKEALGSPSKPQGGAIVYAATRKNTEALAGLIAKEGWTTGMYHAGLPAERRAAVSHDFADGKLNVVVATNAFGMGIDRADIRVVVHANAPGSIEAYYQEVGRAGRDGREAHGLLLSSSSDLGLRRRLLEHGNGGGEGPDKARVDRQWKLFLDLMRYVDAGSCRHDFILRYFGDEQETLGGCGHCDVCERLGETDASGNETAVSEADAIVVRKALAGVARNRGRAGLNAVADMLCGVDNEKTRKLGMTDLSTFGILKSHPRVWVVALLKRLIVAGLVDITASEYPIPVLTKAGNETMMATRAVRVLVPEPDAGVKKKKKKGTRGSAPAVPVTDLPAGFDASLFDRLREVRMQIAQQKGMPAYVVAHDRTLREIAAQKPTSRAALAQVYGMGPARIDSYGDQLIRAVLNG